MKRPIVLATALMVLVLAACQQQPSLGQAQATFCASLATLTATVEQVKTLPANPTAAQVRTAGTAVRDAWIQVTTSAQELKDVKLEALQTSYDELSASIEGAKDDSTMTQTLITIQAAIAKFDATAKVLTSTVCRNATQ